eukprot:6150786-Amphidinium_carterae.1
MVQCWEDPLTGNVLHWQWTLSGGSEYEERDLPVTMVKDEVQPLCDEKGERAGTMAWLEASDAAIILS